MADMGTALAANLEVRINKLEKEMRRASDVSSKTFDGIERRSKQSAQRLEQNMAKAGAAMRSSLSGIDKMLLGGLATGGLLAFGNGVQRIVGDMARLGDQAKRAGVSLEAFQEWKHVAEQNRIPIESMSDALKEMSIRADEFATTGKGSAAEAFARLGMSPEDVQRKLADPSALMLELIERTRALGNTAAGVRSFDELFGGNGGEKLVALLSKSQGELKGTIQQAHDLGLVISDELVANAAELDAKFNIVANTVGTALKTAIVEAATALAAFIEKFQAFDQQTTNGLKSRMREIGLKRVELENLTIMQQGKLDRGETGLFGMNAGALSGQIEDRKGEMAALLDQEKEILSILDQREPIVWPPAGATAPPAAPAAPPAGGSGGGSKGTSRNPYAELVAGAREFIAAQQLEQQTIGMTAEAASRLRQQQELLNQAQKAGLDLSPQQRAEIEQLGAAMAAAEEKTKSLTKAQQGAEQAGQFLGDGLSNAFADVILGASSAEDAIAGLLQQLARAALQAAFMGSGPLGGLTGGVGLFSALGLAEGGEVRGPGTSTSDSIPALLSDGEHVIRASQARKHRALLNAINAGEIGRFANGGTVGKIAALPASAGNVVTIAPTIHIEGGSRGPVADQALGEEVAKQIEGMVRGVLGDEISRQRRPGNTLNSRAV